MMKMVYLRLSLVTFPWLIRPFGSDTITEKIMAEKNKIGKQMIGINFVYFSAVSYVMYKYIYAAVSTKP